MNYYVYFTYVERNPIAIAGIQRNSQGFHGFRTKEQVNQFIEQFTEENKLLTIRVIKGEEIPVEIEKEEYTITKRREKIVGLK